MILVELYHTVISNILGRADASIPEKYNINTNCVGAISDHARHPKNVTEGAKKKRNIILLSPALQNVTPP